MMRLAILAGIASLSTIIGFFLGISHGIELSWSEFEDESEVKALLILYHEGSITKEQFFESVNNIKEKA